MKIDLGDGRVLRLWFRYKQPYTYAMLTMMIADKSKTFELEGVANCSFKDQFSRVRGRKIALARAIRSYLFTKADRTVIWRQFLAVVRAK